MKNERSPLTKPSMFCLAAALMLVAPVALAQETKGAVSATPSSRPATNIPASETPAAAATPAHTPQQDQKEMAAEDDELFYEPLQVGDATQGLLTWQRSGEIESATSRPITGAVANRSYERYLKSFEFPIPERMTSSVKSTNGGNGSSGK